MARFTLKIAKAQVLRKQLNALPDKAKARIVQALADGGAEIVETAKSLVPVDEGVLRDSIRTEFTTPDRNSIVVGPSGEYLKAHGRATNLPRFVEFGTQAQKKGQRVASLGKRGKVRQRISQGDHDATPAQPFLYPAYRVKKKAVRGRIAKAVNQAMKDTAKDKSGGDA